MPGFRVYGCRTPRWRANNLNNAPGLYIHEEVYALVDTRTPLVDLDPVWANSEYNLQHREYEVVLLGNACRLSYARYLRTPG